MMRVIELETEFLHYLEMQKGCTPATLRTYRSAFQRCRAASAAVGVPEPELETVDRRWANRLVQELARHLRPRSVHRNVTALRSLFQYAREEEITDNDPWQGIRLPKKDPVNRSPISSDDLNALLDSAKRLFEPRERAMARALLLTASTTGLRYSELMALEVTDIDLSAGTVTVRHGKGDKARSIPLPGQVVDALRQWLRARREWLDTRSERPGRLVLLDAEPTALWLADRGRRLGEDGLRRLIRELSHAAGIDRPIRIHDVRHAAATRMARQGMPLVGIQAILGHTALSTTQGYIAGAGPHLQDWAERMVLPEPNEVGGSDDTPEKPVAAGSTSARGRFRRALRRVEAARDLGSSARFQ